MRGVVSTNDENERKGTPNNNLGFLGASKPAVEDPSDDDDFGVGASTLVEDGSGDEGVSSGKKIPADGQPLLRKQDGSRFEPVNPAGSVNASGAQGQAIDQHYNWDGVFAGTQEPTQVQKDALELLFAIAKEGQNFSNSYRKFKNITITVVTLLSLVLYIKTALEISNCDLSFRNKLCNLEMAIRALIGTCTSNAAVAVNTLLLEFEYFERKIIPDLVLQYFQSKSKAWERLQTVGIISVAFISALPPTTALFQKASDWLKLSSIAEALATFLSNGVLDILPTQIILGQRAAIAAIAVGMPFISIIGVVGYAGYKLLEKCCVSGEKLRQKRLQHLRDTYIESERKKYLAKLDEFVKGITQDTFKWAGREKYFTFEAKLPEGFGSSDADHELTPEKVKDFLMKKNAEKQKQDPSKCAQIGSALYAGGRFVFIAGGVVFTNLGLVGYDWSMIGQMAGLMFPIYANPAQVVMNLAWWQWLVLSHVNALPLGAFLAMINYFGPQAFGYIYDILTGNWDATPGFKMFPKTALLLTGLAGYLCYESRYTSVFLVEQFISALKLWAGTGPAVEEVCEILRASATYIAPTNNFSSCVTVLNSVLVAMAKRGYGGLEGKDEQLFVQLVEQIKVSSNLISNMDLSAFAKSKYAHVQWVEDDELLTHGDHCLEKLYNLENGDANGEQPILFVEKRTAGLFSNCCPGGKKKPTEVSPLLGDEESDSDSNEADEGKSFCAVM